MLLCLLPLSVSGAEIRITKELKVPAMLNGETVSTATLTVGRTLTVMDDADGKLIAALGGSGSLTVDLSAHRDCFEEVAEKNAALSPSSSAVKEIAPIASPSAKTSPAPSAVIKWQRIDWTQRQQKPVPPLRSFYPVLDENDPRDTAALKEAADGGNADAALAYVCRRLAANDYDQATLKELIGRLEKLAEQGSLSAVLQLAKLDLPMGTMKSLRFLQKFADDDSMVALLAVKEVVEDRVFTVDFPNSKDVKTVFDVNERLAKLGWRPAMERLAEMYSSYESRPLGRDFATQVGKDLSRAFGETWKYRRVIELLAGSPVFQKEESAVTKDQQKQLNAATVAAKKFIADNNLTGFAKPPPEMW